jgi:molybdopterin converting factor small subunit
MTLDSQFLQFTNNVEVSYVTGNNVSECVDDLVRQYPALKEVLFDKEGKPYRYFEIYINKESAYPDELQKPVKDGDQLHISMILHGG